ncbi:class I SAM-dependent methyltransferase [Algoriphagus marinus]|uniref:class I SAM-dependent methyltransferase n=1 Tax=Algoriphagus marinus TaxID=1925762 RepID=UPI000A47949F|nr:methyltransferase domain-containing protein [Algoriphagus marinus]
MNNRIFSYDLQVYNKKSAEVVIPLLRSFQSFNSVLDVGCGIGTWLAIAKSNGIPIIRGIDGDYDDKSLLFSNISKKEFIATDLNKGFNLDQHFDIAICLEVVEHLVSDSAPIVVQSLVRHSDVILFSAAIPGQGGQNHINEQWPNYWAKLFEEHDFVFLDIIRPLIWNNPNVDFWYKQNIFLVVKNTHELALKYSSSHLPLVHPELFERINQNKDNQIDLLKKQLAINPLKRWIASILKKK